MCMAEIGLRRITKKNVFVFSEVVKSYFGGQTLSALLWQKEASDICVNYDLLA